MIIYTFFSIIFTFFLRYFSHFFLFFIIFFPLLDHLLHNFLRTGHNFFFYTIQDFHSFFFSCDYHIHTHVRITCMLKRKFLLRMSLWCFLNNSLIIAIGIELFKINSYSIQKKKHLNFINFYNEFYFSWLTKRTKTNKISKKQMSNIFVNFTSKHYFKVNIIFILNYNF